MLWASMVNTSLAVAGVSIGNWELIIICGLAGLISTGMAVNIILKEK